MNTAFLIMAQFGPVVRLDAIAWSMLNLSDAQAQRKAAHSELPFPVFKEGQKGAVEIVYCPHDGSGALALIAQKNQALRGMNFGRSQDKRHE